MKYKATIIIDTDIKDKDEFYDNLSDALDTVDGNDLEIVEFEEVDE